MRRCDLPARHQRLGRILTDSTVFDISKLIGHQQITDLYLVGLAAHFGGKLATFDTAIPVAGLVAAPADLVEVIPAP